VIEKGEKRFPGEIQNGVIAKRDLDITLDNGTILHIKSGQFYPLQRSKRFSREEMKKLLKIANCNIKYTQDIQGSEIIVVSKKPSQWLEHQKKIKTALLIALAFGAGFSGKSVYDAKVQRDRIQQAEEWFF
jgi:hypothetical protein